MSKTTIYDVAEAAEVGIGTVSRVLNNSEKVSDETRNKVLKVIKELNYYPNGMARGLALQRTNAIGVMVPSFIDHFFVEVLRGVQAGLNQFDLDLVLFKVDKEEKDKHINRVLQGRKVDGVLAITLDLTKEEVNKFKELDLPLVLVDDYQQDVNSIFVDDIAGVKKAISYLIELGHQRIAFFDGPLESNHGKQRLEGVKIAFAEAGLEFDEQLLQEGDFTVESGYQSMKKILDVEERPTAIFAASDDQAVGALEAIKEEGLSVPDGFALIGYDNIELARYLDLTTVSQPMFKMGELGIETLAKLIYSKQDDLIKKKIEPKLVIRNSC
ncbi:transcriptional regulator [Halobacteroides halobius DSM 5150]|uniref:Transcriptional regulator n=1 Tax=Halobacteroides halobius (strain ATCC 35273 / DSM 5150 / MD-1) TaxID=748449 RepID=L0K6Y3_HALHC|nr:LacI family DNA-binding transcriptional regulator [Halobacteroides halobius]AGB40134.1 transcriptional regulator [Halobacteroides halobius DSM 5150]